MPHKFIYVRDSRNLQLEELLPGLKSNWFGTDPGSRVHRPTEEHLVEKLTQSLFCASLSARSLPKSIIINVGFAPPTTGNVAVLTT